MPKEDGTPYTDDEVTRFVDNLSTLAKHCFRPIKTKEDFAVFERLFRSYADDMINLDGPAETAFSRRGIITYKFMEMVQNDYPELANHDYINTMKLHIGSPN